MKKTIRRSVQLKTKEQARMINMRGWARNKIKAMNEATKRGPDYAERQSLLNGLTNWQRNQLLRRVDRIDKMTPAHLKVILGTIKRPA